MKILKIFILGLVLPIFESCTTPRVSGTYTCVFAEVGGEEFSLTREPNKFEYYSRTEGSIKSYSSGTWSQNKKEIFLKGFDDETRNVLNVGSKIENYPNENRNKIFVQYKKDLLDTFTKVDLVINESPSVHITGDTLFFINTEIKSLRLKAYFAHEGLLLVAPPCIDTLYSSVIEVSNPSNYKSISLKFEVAQNDFYRTNLTDTLSVKNTRTIKWSGKTFKRLRK